MARGRVDADEIARREAQRLAAQRLQAPAHPKGNGMARPGPAAGEAPAPHPLEAPAESFRLDQLGWLDREPPAGRWLLQDSLALGEVGVVAAPGSTSKTWLLLQMAVGVASCTSICDFGLAGALWRPVSSCGMGVLVLTAEEQAEDLHRRVWAIAQALGVSGAPLDWLKRNLHIGSVRGQDNLLIQREPGSLRWKRTEQAHRIADLAERIPDLGLIILEPVSRFRGSDENDSSAASALVGWMETVSMRTGATVLTAAHAAKWARNEEDLSQDSIRGSSALVDGVRWGCIMRRMQGPEAHRYGISEEERRKLIQVAIPKANNTTRQGNQWLEQMSGGVLRFTRIHTANRGPEDDDYQGILGAVKAFLSAHAGERWSIRRLETAHGGSDGVFRVSQKRLRVSLGRAVETGDLALTDGALVVPAASAGAG
jgi:RecA-family ATPase